MSRKRPSIILIVHNAHLFIHELGKKFDTTDTSSIAENKEKYINFNVKTPTKLDKDENPEHKKIELQFNDIFRFMTSSLDKLSSNLSAGQCKNLQQFYDKEDVFQLMRDNGVYPYKHMDSWKRFKETILSNKEVFCSKRYMADIVV